MSTSYLENKTSNSRHGRECFVPLPLIARGVGILICVTQELLSTVRFMDDFKMYFVYILMCAQHFGDLYPIYLKLLSKDATMLFNIVKKI